jgi:hypothetical protein
LLAADLLGGLAVGITGTGVELAEVLRKRVGSTVSYMCSLVAITVYERKKASPD